jgi:hypothetical protein
MDLPSSDTLEAKILEGKNNVFSKANIILQTNLLSIVLF